jgi:hypothetical protein
VSTGLDPTAPDLPSVAYDAALVDLGTIPAGATYNVWLYVDDLPNVIPTGTYGFSFGIGHAAPTP